MFIFYSTLAKISNNAFFILTAIFSRCITPYSMALPPILIYNVFQKTFFILTGIFSRHVRPYSMAMAASPPESIYDVFLSFRGRDTRENFISRLYQTLEEANINTFIDTKIPRGDSISSSLFQAIKTSRIAIIVLSPNFASSNWCLDELVYILECKHSSGQLVLPVFFHVDPSDLQKQTGVFQRDLAELEDVMKVDPQNVEMWRSALLEVADIVGWHIDITVDEAEVIQQIVKEVSSRLSKSRLSRISSFFRSYGPRICFELIYLILKAIAVKYIYTA